MSFGILYWHSFQCIVKPSGVLRMDIEFKKIRWTTKSIAFVAVIFITIVSLFAFRTVSVSQIWNGYRVLYVANSVDEKSVLEQLAASGCREVITRSAQKIPMTSPFFSNLMDSSSYLNDRDGYFHDGSSQYNLFYIPDEYESEIENAVKLLVKNFHVQVGVDTRETYPFVIPLIVLAVYILLCFVSIKKVHFAFPGVFSMLFAFSMPFYSVACGVCLFLFALYLSNRMWGRKNVLDRLFKNIYVDALLAASVLAFISESVKCLALAAFVIASGVCALLLLREVREYKTQHATFQFSLIFTANQMPVVYAKNIRYLIYLLVPISLLLIVCLFSARFSSSVSPTGIAMPSPVDEGSVENSALLPNMNDYFKWAWNIMVFPYRDLNTDSLSGEVKEGDSVVVPRYENNVNGVKVKEETVFAFNNSFRKDMDKYVSDLEYPAIEKLFKEQSRNVSVAYSVHSQVAQKRGDIFSILVIIFSLCVPAILVMIYYTADRVKI